MPLLSPSARALVVPGSARRVLRRPDLRGLVLPQLSGEPLSSAEVDHDDLVILRSWRSYDPVKPGEVKYFMYELAQRNPGESEYVRLVKCVRLIRLTRVPRYLRQSGGGGANMVFEQQRDVMVALREAQVLFLNVIAKSPQLPLVFGYGVQAVAATVEEAQAQADDAYAVLTFQLDGTYQQLEYKPLDVREGELLARYQAEWDQIAIARGRPLPQGTSLGSSALLDGNRTDVESTNNQLESFLRGMSDRSFMLSLVTVPLSPAEMTTAWRNVVQKLSAVRSDQQGTRSVTAGVALPLALGSSFGDSHGNSHSVGAGQGIGTTDGTSRGQTEGVSYSDARGSSVSQTEGVSVSQSQGVSQTVAEGISQTSTRGENAGVSQTQTVGLSQSLSDSMSEGRALGESLSAGESTSQGSSVSRSEGESLTATEAAGRSVSVGSSQGLTDTRSLSHGFSTSEGQSLSDARSAGTNWANSAGESLSGSRTQTEGVNQSQANSLSQSLSGTHTKGDSLGTSLTQTSGQDAKGGVLGFSGGGSSSSAQANSGGQSASDALSTGLTGGASHTTGVTSSLADSLSKSTNIGESYGGTLGRSATATNSVGTGESVGTGQSLASSQSQSATQGSSLSQSMARGFSASEGVGQSFAQGSSLSRGVSATDSFGLGRTVGIGESASDAAGQSRGVSASEALGASRTQSAGESQSVGQGQSRSVGVGESRTATEAVSSSANAGVSQALSQQQSLTDAYMVAMSRSAMSTSSLGVAPHIGISTSKTTFDEAKRVIGDLLQAQMARYYEGVQSGAFLYQMFLVCEDRNTLLGASGLLKSAFWGIDDSQPLVQPFQVWHEFPDEDERRRLLTHAQAWTSYRKREPNMEIIEPFAYSSYLTPSEATAFTHPPVAESLGLLAQHDSMPVMAMPSDRAEREIYLGRIVNGERGKVSDWRYGVDLSDLTHTLVAGVTGSGKTTTLMRFLTEAVAVKRTVVTPPTPENPVVHSREVPAGILGLDWMRNMRDLARAVEPERFRFYSVAKPDLGAFRWNLLALPDEGMNPDEWLNSQADNFTSSMNLGEFGRSLIAEFLGELYTANRLEDYVLRPAAVDPDTGMQVRPAEVLPAVDAETLPPGAIQTGPNGLPVANVYTCPSLSRLVDMTHFATLVAAKVEQLADPNAARLHGTAMRDRIQSVWRRVQYYAPGGQYAQMLAGDRSLTERTTLGVSDLIDPEKGLVTIIETDGLDLANRRLILGSVMLAIYRKGMHAGSGVFDQGGKGPGTFIVLEESHALLGERGADEDSYSAGTRTALYEEIARMSRTLGMRMIYVAQNPDALPEAITSNISTVLIHRVYAESDRKRVFSMLNWTNQIGQQMREFRYLGEMPTGYCIVRLSAQESWLESAPCHILADPVGLAPVPDAELRAMALSRRR